MKLKKFEKMTKTELLVFCLMAISSGVVIGIGGVSSLLAISLLGAAGRLVGATLFSLGIYAIVAYEMRLFTGMIADIPTLGLKNCWRLPVCFLCNILGVAIVALLAYYTPVSEQVVAQAKALIGGKLAAENWAIKSFCSAVLCGVLITISVKSVKFAPQKGLSSTVGVILPIIVFAFCGFDHSVANMLYFYYLGECSWKIVGYILLSILGNIVGGVALPTITLIKARAQQPKEEQAAE
ncbi:MAG: formate/nitrite transporter family protein [Clostridia bacterium]|nr:formate/nitrite transporter family protein [Clostridia bacterium]